MGERKDIEKLCSLYADLCCKGGMEDERGELEELFEGVNGPSLGDLNPPIPFKSKAWEEKNPQLYTEKHHSHQPLSPSPFQHLAHTLVDRVREGVRERTITGT